MWIILAYRLKCLGFYVSEDKPNHRKLIEINSRMKNLWICEVTSGEYFMFQNFTCLLENLELSIIINDENLIFKMSFEPNQLCFSEVNFREILQPRVIGSVKTKAEKLYSGEPLDYDPDPKLVIPNYGINKFETIKYGVALVSKEGTKYPEYSGEELIRHLGNFISGMFMIWTPEIFLEVDNNNNILSVSNNRFRTNNRVINFFEPLEQEKNGITFKGFYDNEYHFTTSSQGNVSFKERD